MANTEKLGRTWDAKTKRQQQVGQMRLPFQQGKDLENKQISRCSPTRGMKGRGKSKYIN